MRERTTVHIRMHMVPACLCQSAHQQRVGLGARVCRVFAREAADAEADREHLAGPQRALILGVEHVGACGGDRRRRRHVRAANAHASEPADEHCTQHVFTCMRCTANSQLRMVHHHAHAAAWCIIMLMPLHGAPSCASCRMPHPPGTPGPCQSPRSWPADPPARGAPTTTATARHHEQRSRQHHYHAAQHQRRCARPPARTHTGPTLSCTTRCRRSHKRSLPPVRAAPHRHRGLHGCLCWRALLERARRRLVRRQQRRVLTLLRLVGVDHIAAAQVGAVALVARAQRHEDHA